MNTAAAGLCLACAALLAWAGPAPAAPAAATAGIQAEHILRVGPARDIQTIARAARLAPAGATIEVDAGTYRGDTAVWTRDGVTVRAVGGRVRLLADGEAAEGKGIWVVRAEGMTVEGFDFEGARVPGRNGAGIRFERGSLHVRDCRFVDNETGLLTGNDPSSSLVIENSEFARIPGIDGQNHNLYVGTIARLAVRSSYFHHAEIGHLLKSRAAVSVIEYNRLTDEGGSASYELEFPNGGVAYVVGNLIQQSARTENEQIISFGAEGYRWPDNELYLVNNTVVDDRPRGGVFLYTAPGVKRVLAVNNLWVGNGRLPADGAAELHNNFAVDRSVFAAAHGGDFRLKPASPVWHRAVDPGTANGMALAPRREYRHPRSSRPLATPPLQPGAMQSPASDHR